MNDSDANHPDLPGRRRFLATAATAATVAAAVPMTVLPTVAQATAVKESDNVPFWGARQAGVVTPQQGSIYFAAFDLVTTQRDDVIALLRAWTQAAARLTQGLPVSDAAGDASAPPVDTGEAEGISPSRLTLTFGFGPSLFSKDGADRYGLAKHRPDALVDLPRFNGDQLVAARTGGDLCVQACADEPQVAFHAVRQLARVADAWARMRWAQSGFLAQYKDKETPRNLMGFKDGTMNPPIGSKASMDKFVWTGSDGGWMKDGTYMVARPIRIALEHWDRMKLGFQEQVMGRSKATGAALGRQHEFDSLDLSANDAAGNPVLPETSHVRLGAPKLNEGAQVLRRSYSYDNGLSFTAERWPPWRQGMEFDAGLLFVCFQGDPRTGFIKIFDKMSKFDMMNQFVTHVGGGLFACPPGAPEGGYIGQPLFELA